MEDLYQLRFPPGKDQTNPSIYFGRRTYLSKRSVNSGTVSRYGSSKVLITIIDMRSFERLAIGNGLPDSCSFQQTGICGTDILEMIATGHVTSMMCTGKRMDNSPRPPRLRYF